MKFIETLNAEMQEYFKILSPEFPEWLEEYINVPEMQRLKTISMSVGWDYSTYKKIKYFISKLEHSVGVALVVYHFTKNKKQTLAGLFHDIASPVFLHCIDFMNGDAEKQESTEDKTLEIIENSKEIMRLLNRDGIKVEEVADYHVYPVADNDTPKLSADRLEYTFSCGLIQLRVWELETIKKCYNDMVLSVNEDGVTEIAFSHKNIAEEYVKIISKLWPTWADEKNKVYMQFLADICKSMLIKGYLKSDDLWKLSEREVIDKILNCEDKYLAMSMKHFINGKKITVSNTKIDGKYCIKMKGKLRYIIPLVAQNGKAKRINEVSEIAKNQIDNFLNQKFDKYGCLDFDFKPY